MPSSTETGNNAGGKNSTTSTAASQSPANVPALRWWERLNPATGQIVSQVKYMKGSPRQYRFDAKKGSFNLYGNIEAGKTLTFQPIAYRLFKDDILGMGLKKWIELFFIDPENCVSSILFHSYSVQEFQNLLEQLIYSNLAVTDLVFTVSGSEKKNTKINATYYIAQWSYHPADAATTAQLKEFAETVPLYRADTFTEACEILLMQNYTPPVEDNHLPAADIDE